MLKCHKNAVNEARASSNTLINFPLLNKKKRKLPIQFIYNLLLNDKRIIILKPHSMRLNTHARRDKGEPTWPWLEVERGGKKLFKAVPNKNLI